MNTQFSKVAQFSQWLMTTVLRQLNDVQAREKLPLTTLSSPMKDVLPASAGDAVLIKQALAKAFAEVSGDYSLSRVNIAVPGFDARVQVETSFKGGVAVSAVALHVEQCTASSGLLNKLKGLDSDGPTVVTESKTSFSYTGSDNPRPSLDLEHKGAVKVVGHEQTYRLRDGDLDSAVSVKVNFRDGAGNAENARKELTTTSPAVRDDGQENLVVNGAHTVVSVVTTNTSHVTDAISVQASATPVGEHAPSSASLKSKINTEQHRGGDGSQLGLSIDQVYEQIFRVSDPADGPSQNPMLKRATAPIVISLGRRPLTSQVPLRRARAAAPGAQARRSLPDRIRPEPTTVAITARRRISKTPPPCSMSSAVCITTCSM